MSIFRVEKYVVKPEKQAEYLATMKKWASYVKKNRDKRRELRSWRLFSQTIGDNVGEYTEMWELESLVDYEKFMHGVFHGQDDSVRKIVSRFTTCIVPGTYSVSIWNSII